MRVYYLDESIQLLCEDQRQCRRRLGEENWKKIQRRLREMAAAEHVTDLVAGRPHALERDRAGEYSLDLHGGCRLVFRPAHPLSLHGVGEIRPDWSVVTEVCIVYIGDYHD